jgi:hypothetical protein
MLEPNKKICALSLFSDEIWQSSFFYCNAIDGTNFEAAQLYVNYYLLAYYINTSDACM